VLDGDQRDEFTPNPIDDPAIVAAFILPEQPQRRGLSSRSSSQR